MRGAFVSPRYEPAPDTLRYPSQVCRDPAGDPTTYLVAPPAEARAMLGLDARAPRRPITGPSRASKRRKIDKKPGRPLKLQPLVCLNTADEFDPSVSDFVKVEHATLTHGKSRMTWQVIVHSEPCIVETRYLGSLTPNELEEAARETIRMGIECGSSLFLGDCSRLSGGHSPMDLYLLANIVQDSPMGRTAKEAILLPARASAQSEVRFWETTARNRGLDIRIFGDRSSALAWLAEAAE